MTIKIEYRNGKEGWYDVEGIEFEDRMERGTAKKVEILDRHRGTHTLEPAEVASVCLYPSSGTVVEIFLVPIPDENRE